MSAVSAHSSILVPLVIVRVGNYLIDDASVLASVKVCKAWKKHLEERLKHCHEDEYCRRKGYPIEFVYAFRSQGLSLWRLPVLTLSNPDLDYIHVKEDEMTSPVMRFTAEGERVGLAFKAKGCAEGMFVIPPKNDRLLQEEKLIRDFSTVFTVFMRYPQRSLWIRIDENHIPTLIYQQVHNPVHQGNRTVMCPLCSPFERGYTRTWVRDVITKRDAVLEINGKVQQVKQPAPLPKIKPPPFKTNFVPPHSNPFLALSWLLNQISLGLSWLGTRISLFFAFLLHFFCSK